MIPDAAADEPWTRILPQYAEKREQVVEAVEALIWRGRTHFTVRMVRAGCDAVTDVEWFNRPTVNLIERTLAEMVEAGFLRIHAAGAPGRARVYAYAGRAV